MKKPAVRRCETCRKLVPVTEFRRDTRCRDGHSRVCTMCEKKKVELYGGNRGMMRY